MFCDARGIIIFSTRGCAWLGMLLFYIPDIPRLMSAYVKYTSKKVNSYGRMACMGKTTDMILLKLIINGNVRCYDRNFILNVHHIQSIIPEDQKNKTTQWCSTGRHFTAGLLPCCRVKTMVTNKALTSKKKRHTVFLKKKEYTYLCKGFWNTNNVFFILDFCKNNID